MSELYEMWSVFTITKVAIDELLADGYRMVSNTTFYELEKGYFQFEVRKNFASIVLAKDDLRVEIKYEPVYVNQASVMSRSAIVAAIGGGNPQTPDMAIEVYRNGEIQDVLVFDAKYRWERGNDGFFYPKDEDMENMHSYRSRIQYKRYDPGRARNPYRMENIVESAYILYPGNRISKEANDRVGGLPLRPDMSREHFEEVKEQLRDLLYYT